ncbi:MAG: hypothetical protein J1F63_00580 [Oscillospiraceae bacterium]|nr:hypothetical protein [Oscillospiraceae bacterium]
MFKDDITNSEYAAKGGQLINAINEGGDTTVFIFKRVGEKAYEICSLH